MFTNSTAKTIGDEVRWNANVLRQALRMAFQNAILNERREVSFFRNLLKEVKNVLENVKLPGLNIRCRTKETHQKPIVRVQAPRPFQCELADLLVVVKYAFGPKQIERKSLLYQVKLCDSEPYCKIDTDQLELSCDWPEFEFGLLSQGGPSSYSFSPHTLEFGSFMLMRRAPALHDFIPCRSHFCYFNSYGVSPHALAVRRSGPRTVDVSKFPYAASAAEALFSQLAFEIGEHHEWNPKIAALIDALYRHLGIDPDPPAEFDGYFREVGEEELGFGLIEVDY